jgi:hypothetical protein
METDYSNINIHPIFEPIKKIFGFFVLSIGFVGQKEFQRLFLESHPEMRPLVENYNKEVTLRVEGTTVKSETHTYWITVGRLMAIAIFDILQSSKYHAAVQDTEIYQFARHLRNGAAHDNIFNIQMKLNNPIVWRDKSITNALNKTTVFPDFISPASLLHLAADISRVIESTTNA